MPLSLALDGRVVRHTYWSDSKQNIVQVACAVICEADWEVLVEITRLVGPFDNAKVEMRQAQDQALAAADRQMPGQLALGA